ncbi:MAG: hypothetical protein UV01_C0009G0011 [Parcubacteria group bacterium GW2011_GWA2_42_14]|nr:MAG: hypothetical protein UV01_C0009G0011 [Parcubacteria group bacterium GW2011_GWA2_42_14]
MEQKYEGQSEKAPQIMLDVANLISRLSGEIEKGNLTQTVKESLKRMLEAGIKDLSE